MSTKIDDMLNGLIEMGNKPGNEEYQPLLKDLALLIKDHVELTSAIKSKVALAKIAQNGRPMSEHLFPNKVQ